MPNKNNLIDTFIDYKKKELSPRSQVEYIRDLTQLEIWLKGMDKTLRSANRRDIDSYIHTVPVGKRMTNRKLSVIRTFYNYLLTQELITKNPTSDIKRIKADRLLPRILTQTELNIIFNYDLYPKNSFKSILFSTIVMTMYYTGVRVSELLGIDYPDIDIETRQIRVLGKGRKERMVKFSLTLLNWFHSYEHYREQHIKPGEIAWFISDRGRRLTINMVEALFRRFKDKTGAHIHPHLLRHTFASHGMAKGMTLAEVQQLLGHESIASTGIYTHVVPGRAGEAYDKAFK